MANSRDDKLLGQIERLFDRGAVASLSDEQILERFAIHHDGAAFRALVARHGSTVLAVCRRFLRDPNDVEDAFQATFVILVRKAGGLRDREALGPWLYGVAYRVASRARADAVRRRRRESVDEEAIALVSAPDPGLPELRWLLDEEIARLPHKLRLPVVLCLMEGQTYDEAANQLRWTSSMVRGRLAEARSRLRERLIRRGEAPFAVLAWIEFEPSPVAPGLIDAALSVVAHAGSGKAATSSAVALANRTMRSWIMSRIGTAALVMVGAGVALGVGAMGLRLVAQDREKPMIVLAQADRPAQEREKADAPPVPVVAPKRVGGAMGSEIHPVTIEGRALDQDGRPVAGASIMVTNANRSRPGGSDKVLGRCVSGLDGRFVLRDLPLPVLQPDPSPIPKPAEGRFEVAGWAPGLAFAWHKIQSYRPSPRPADFKETEPGLVIYTGEPIHADLVLGPPARIHGRIIDDQGLPVVGAKVQVGYIDDPRRPDGSGMWNCRLADPAGGDVPREFTGIDSLPESRRSAQTDADGRYVIDGLPREAQLLSLIDQDLTLEPHSPTIATSTTKLEGVRSLGYDGELNHEFIRPRTVRVRVTLADSGQPAPKVTVLAQGAKMQRAGAIGTTDAEGRMTLALPLGSYTLRLEPPFGLSYLLSEQSFEVKGDARESSVDISLDPAAVVVLKAVDADSGEVLAGAGFEFVTDTSADRKALHSQTVFVDHPTTDQAGNLRAVMVPGRRQFLVSQVPEGYEPLTKASPMLILKPSETATTRFEFKKRPEPVAKDQEPEQDQVGQRLRTIWQAQSQLIQRGRMRARRIYQSGDSIPLDRLQQLLESLDPDKVPPLLELIPKTFPEAGPSHGLTLNSSLPKGK
ncbi:sigma-70 family RNA polymerase sigma factor [Singulisphaera acidiphila]|uniref:RNA polymerase sigma factor, sigma-70 family n=1 Tax=Singulisphaera acidiphila (strain ATCC BAA-1392 / DSM 18658 / VKM B-2454 / MOB10) TaxID=886293 RepID=L0DQ81_SINAD|nr:sigma-70 family RNA polymerase sigma factor [Singulisphaera acidiphila]AGA31544.1 RNA polymerase sigma factor, sigma-70 family [Singulisphaera acidiphila DSM 18658]